MKQIWVIFLTAMLFWGFPQAALAQASEGQLTIKEMQETKRLLAMFEKRLDETQDVEQALQAVGGKDWFENTLRHARNSNVSDLSEIGFQQQLLTNHEKEYRRVLIAMYNFLYLMLLNTTQAEVEEGEEDWIKSLPAEVLETLRNNQYWNAMLNEINGETNDAEAWEIKTLPALLAVSITAERACDILRSHLQGLDAETKQAVKGRFAKNKKEMGSEPHLHICNEECASQPAGTRTAVANYLLFQLTFAKVGNEMKLVLIASRIGE